MCIESRGPTTFISFQTSLSSEVQLIPSMFGSRCRPYGQVIQPIGSVINFSIVCLETTAPQLELMNHEPIDIEQFGHSSTERCWLSRIFKFLLHSKFPCRVAVLISWPLSSEITGRSHVQCFEQQKPPIYMLPVCIGDR